MQKKTKAIPVEKTNNQEINDEWKNKYLRALADYHNLEKRCELEFVNQKKQANKNILIKLIAVIDNIDRAEVFVNDAGLRLVKEEFIKILNEEGLKEIDVINKKFDPYTAECIEVVPDEQDDIVLEVVRKGYMLNDSVLRVAQVKVGKKLSVNIKS